MPQFASANWGMQRLNFSYEKLVKFCKNCIFVKFNKNAGQAAIFGGKISLF